MGDLKFEFIQFMRSNKFRLPLILVAFLCYAYTALNLSVSIDDLRLAFYFDLNMILGRGMLSAFLLHKITGIFVLRPIILDFLAVCFLLVSSVLACVVLKQASGDKLKPIAYTIFSCFFVSYPLICEVFTYIASNLLVALAYCANMLALYHAISFADGKMKKHLVYASLFLIFSINVYESFNAIYLLGVCLVVTLRYFFQDKKPSMRDAFKYAFIMLVPLAIALIEFFVVKYVILKGILHIAEGSGDLAVEWFNSTNLNVTLTDLMKAIRDRYFVAGFVYLPITVFVLSLTIFVVIVISNVIFYKRFSILLFALGAVLSIFITMLLKGAFIGYRTDQALAFFVGVTMALTAHYICRSRLLPFIKYAGLALMFLLVFYQVQDLNKWFYIDNMNYSEACRTVDNIALELQRNYDIENKPVVFVGYPEVSPNIAQYKSISRDNWYGDRFYTYTEGKTTYTSTIAISLLEWCMNCVNGEKAVSINGVGQVVPTRPIYDLFFMRGYSLYLPTTEMYLEANAMMKHLPAWPNKGSIIELEEYILVHI